MALLRADLPISSSLPSNKKEAGGELPDAGSVNILSDNALLPSTSPLGAAGSVGGELFFEDVSVYVVRKGDTISQVAEMFEVSVDTILSANNLEKGSKLKEGDVLLILPFSGVEHTVAKGETLQGVANLYKVSLSDILLFNDMGTDSKLAIGDKLLIPGASIPTASKTAGKQVGRGPQLPSVSAKNVSGYFVNPVPADRRTRGATSRHRGVDIGAPTGTPIYASASGAVLIARNGWNGGYGNMAIIQHPNGTRTLYAHMSRLGTTTGTQISQGEILGYVGSTGRSTGPHLHFEVHGAKNPGQDWSWAR
jgi:LysM repeat protein